MRKEEEVRRRCGGGAEEVRKEVRRRCGACPMHDMYMHVSRVCPSLSHTRHTFCAASSELNAPSLSSAPIFNAIV